MRSLLDRKVETWKRTSLCYSPTYIPSPTNNQAFTTPSHTDRVGLTW